MCPSLLLLLRSLRSQRHHLFGSWVRIQRLTTGWLPGFSDQNRCRPPLRGGQKGTKQSPAQLNKPPRPFYPSRGLGASLCPVLVYSRQGLLVWSNEGSCCLGSANPLGKQDNAALLNRRSASCILCVDLLLRVECVLLCSVCVSVVVVWVHDCDVAC